MKKTLLCLFLLALQAQAQEFTPVKAYSYGARPFYLIDDLPAGELKDSLAACNAQSPQKTEFSIGHRGAPLQFPEHTLQSYLAAARQGAGIIECDVAFTKDKELVCRHAQNDLHTTTNILATPLAEKCSVPFTPAQYDAAGNLIEEAKVECRTSDITLAEFKTLTGKMDAGNPKARTVEEYMAATPNWRTDLYSQNGTLMTHQESIELFKALGVKMTPELKTPVVEMPFDGFTQEQYAQKLLDEYQAAGVAASKVFPQSFNYADVQYWIKNGGDFGKQAVFLDEELDTAARIAEMPKLREDGLNYLAPAMPMLLANQDGKIVPSDYAKAAKSHGFKLISWSIERSGPLANGGGWYYSGLNDLIKKDSDLLKVLDVLAQEVGIVALFSDWPATVTYYANCKGL
ncbi:glycerophosphodiester phosphodiesterase family protein [Suttonella indologenes]|uniref:glycerophosphodiester phosphodiesterase n=1 Tax=Suttonella indologenes TaxID=13276 RepID=A0A380N260_9GAMM|nr:glycerophosphodiester phosphodiesterase family protein [Suttonella indologenes]SUO98642.1 Glycerophosphoryl diester phosphodiesterase precursor [Suttonella indologenes]